MHLTRLPFQRGLKDADHNDCFEDFLEHQGTTNIYLPPVRDTWGFTDVGPLNWGAVDVYGYMNDYIKEACPEKDLGTTVSGTCIKKTKNGKDAYTVHVSTKNANMWAMHFSDLDLSDLTNSCPESDCGANRARFGVRVDTGSMCTDDTDKVLATSRFTIKFELDEGDTIPDLLVDSSFLTSINFNAVGKGTQGTGAVQQLANPNNKPPLDVFLIEKWTYPGQAV
jgi:hypothetical protein